MLPTAPSGLPWRVLATAAAACGAIQADAFQARHAPYPRQRRLMRLLRPGPLRVSFRGLALAPRPLPLHLCHHQHTSTHHRQPRPRPRRTSSLSPSRILHNHALCPPAAAHLLESTLRRGPIDLPLPSDPRPCCCGPIASGEDRAPSAPAATSATTSTISPALTHAHAHPPPHPPPASAHSLFIPDRNVRTHALSTPPPLPTVACAPSLDQKKKKEKIRHKQRQEKG
ncbi:hypothetical protein DFH27DRAFT_16702 [Peziza echinospora]|nr:hypothetical protein DFH27DRAFT_16702 [Peziza echinospora]